MKNISVIIPVYNSSDTLNNLDERLESVIKPISSIYEIIFVNDSSLDSSYEIIKSIIIYLIIVNIIDFI